MAMGMPNGLVASQRAAGRPRFARPLAAGTRRTDLLRTRFWRESLQPGFKAHQALQGVKVVRVSDGVEVQIPDLWDPSTDTAMVVWARSFGCPFCQELATQLVRDVQPRLEQAEVQPKLLLVSIGTRETGQLFAEKTGFPSGQLLADAENSTYDALGLKQGLAVTYLSPLTPVAVAQRAMKQGVADLQAVLKDWQPWQPPRGVQQASVQGGTLIFQGKDCAWSHVDKATADHADMQEAAGVALSIAKKQKLSNSR